MYKYPKDPKDFKITQICMGYNYYFDSFIIFGGLIVFGFKVIYFLNLN